MAEDDNIAEILTSTITSATAATAFASLRMYSVALMRRRPLVEDWIIVASACLLVVGVLVVGLAVRSGMGQHIDTLTEEQVIGAKFYFTLSTWPALLSIGLPKLAVASLLCRVFYPDRLTRMLLWGLAWLGVVNYLTEAVFSTFQCTPVQALWDTRITGARCVDANIYTRFSFYVASYSAFVDFCLAVYPMLVFRKMDYSPWKKLGLSVLLGLGLFAFGLATLKTTYLKTLPLADFTWNRTYLIIWTIVESCVIIVAATVPVLRPVYIEIRGKIRDLKGRQGARDQATGACTRQNPASTDQCFAGAEREGFWTRHIKMAFGACTSATTDITTTQETGPPSYRPKTSEAVETVEMVGITSTVMRASEDVERGLSHISE